jgi:hypothetical protein
MASACGTAVMPTDLTPSGARTEADYCNPGATAQAPDGVLVSGGRFCQQFDSLPNPSKVVCDPLGGGTVGVCTAQCAVPLADGGTLTSDCPPNHQCDTNVGNLFAAFAPLLGCTGDPADCQSQPGSICAGPFPAADGGNLCARRYGVCQPL